MAAAYEEDEEVLPAVVGYYEGYKTGYDTADTGNCKGSLDETMRYEATGPPPSIESNTEVAL